MYLCSMHRYDDAHACTFDYRQQGREDIVRANPKIAAAKI